MRSDYTLIYPNTDNISNVMVHAFWPQIMQGDIKKDDAMKKTIRWQKSYFDKGLEPQPSQVKSIQWVTGNSRQWLGVAFVCKTQQMVTKSKDKIQLETEIDSAMYPQRF